TESGLKDEAGEIGVLGEGADALVDHLRRDLDALAAAVAGGEGNLLQQLFHDRVKAPSPDVLDRGVDLGREVRQGVDRFLGEDQLHLFRRHEGAILADEGVLRFGQDALEVVAGQRCKLYPDRQAPLQFRQQVRGLGQMESPRGDEEDEVRLYLAVLGCDGRALDQRQQVTLHAFAADVRAAAMFRTGGNLVDLVQEDDAVLLDRGNGLADHLLFVQQLVAFLRHQEVVAVGDRYAALAGAAAKGLSEDVVQVDHAHLGARHTGDVHGGELQAAAVLQLQLHFPVPQLPV